MLAGYYNIFHKFVLMDNLQFWLYVIIGIIYLVSRLRKKQAEQPPEPSQSLPKRDEEVPERPMTFEELLREITEGKTEKKPEPIAPSRRPVYEQKTQEATQEVIPETEIDDLEEVEYDYKKQDTIYEKYEEAKRQAFQRASLEETMTLGQTDMKFGKFKEFETKSNLDLLSAYLSDFKDPEGLKKAIVMSEILKRKF